jgi:hypothetical protein
MHRQSVLNPRTFLSGELMPRAFAFAMAFMTVALAALGTTSFPASSADVAVAVRADEELGIARTQLATQFIWPGGLDRSTNARARLAALAPPIIRINVTTDGYPGLPLVMPAGLTKGDWDFSNLDSMVRDAHDAGGRVLITIAYAPAWMWDCATGTLRDPTFAEFGAYAARLVAYYNSGSFVAEDGREILNPTGTADRVTYWELWNEPEQRYAACPPSGGLAPEEYVRMWNAVADAMLAVDPSIKLVGPTTGAPVTTRIPDYLPALIAGARHRPDAVSFHGYGGWLNAQTDRFLFDGDGACCGLAGIDRGVAQVRATAGETPIWTTELNVNAAWDGDDPAARPWTAYGAAWGASAFARFARAGVGTVYQFQFVHPKLSQFSMLDAAGSPLLPYWRDYYLARYFPPGSVLLSATSSQSEIETLAARPPGSTNVRVLVVNRRVDSDSAIGGPGSPATVQVTVSNLAPAMGVTLRIVDATTPLASGPTLVSLAGGDTASVTLPGYGFALLEFVVGP